MKHLHLALLFMGLCPLMSLMSCTKNKTPKVTLDRQAQALSISAHIKDEFKAVLNEVRTLQTTKQKLVKEKLKTAGVSDKEIALALKDLKQPLAKTEKALNDISAILVKKFGEEREFGDLPKKEVDALIEDYLQAQLFALPSAENVSYLSEAECRELLKDTKNEAVKIGLYLLCRFTPNRD